MTLVKVLFLLLLHANFIVSKSISSVHNTNYTNTNSNENDPTTQITSTQINKTTEDTKSLLGLIMQDNSEAEMRPDLINSTEPIGSVRKSDVSDIQNNPTRNAVLKKKGTRQADEEQTTLIVYHTTTEDTLRHFLSIKLPFPHPAPDQVGQTDKGVMYPVTRPVWTFEGYDDSKSANERVVDNNMDCEGQRVRCMADTEYNQPVCVTDQSMPESVPAPARQKGFASSCEVEYRNCLKRYELTGKYYADSISEDYLEFEHYGWCQKCSVINIYCHF